MPVAQAADQHLICKGRRKDVIPGSREWVIGPPARCLFDGTEAVYRQKGRAVGAILLVVLIVGETEEHEVGLRDAVVDPYVARILRERATECSDPVGIDERIDVGVRRQGGVIEEKLRHRTDPGRIDY